MAKQSFSVGQVLTANQMLSLQQTAMLGGSATAKTASYTLVAADAGTVVSVNSTSATTITVNTGLFSAGDTVTIQNWGSGAVTITAGTATVNTAGSLIVPQYDGGVLYFTSASEAIYFDFVQAGAVSPLTTKGDLYTFGSSDTRLGVGANDTVLTADSSTATGLKWATPAAGGMTLLSTTTLSGTSTTISSISGDYTDLYIVLNNPFATGAGYLRISPNGTDSITHNTTVVPAGTLGQTNIDSYGAVATTSTPATSLFLKIIQYKQTTYGKPFIFFGGTLSSTSTYMNMAGTIRTTSAITSMKFAIDGGFSWSGGQVLIYGVK